MRVVALTLAALALSSVGAHASSAPPPSGLRGIVMRSPTRPVCLESESCEAPAVGLVLQFKRGGVVVARARTGSAGEYRVRLRPGPYIVATSRSGPVVRLTPSQVRVRTGTFRRIDFELDTGIR